jgi:hypothetical protein
MSASASTFIAHPESVQSYARLGGILALISVLAGSFGEGYVPSMLIVSGNAAATAGNFVEHEMLFRWGFTGYLVEAICDATLTMVFWVLVRPVHQNLAMLMVVFRILATGGFAAAQVLYHGAFATARSAEQLSGLGSAQLQGLSYSFVTVATFGGQLFTTFYGLATLVFAHLLWRSRLLPRWLSVLLAIMGFAFVLRTILMVLAPAYASPLLLGTAALGMLPLTFWLLVKGVDASRWRAVASV